MTPIDKCLIPAARPWLVIGRLPTGQSFNAAPRLDGLATREEAEEIARRYAAAETKGVTYSLRHVNRWGYEIPVPDTCDKPLAAPGLTSYRYRGRYGWIMIGASDDADALREAARSTGTLTSRAMLETWDAEAKKYRPVD